MNNIAERIKQLRKEAGKSEREVAAALDMTIYEYGDLEAYDNEIIDAVTLPTAQKVAAYFNKSLLELLAPEQETWPNSFIELPALTDLLHTKIKEQRLSRTEAEDQIGWYLEEFFAHPEAYLAANPLLFFIDVSTFLGINWLATIPRKIDR